MLWLLYVVIAFILMSLSTFLVKKLFKEVNPLVVLFYQYLIAIPLVWFYSLLLQAGFGQGSYLIFLLGLFYVIGIAFFYLALKKGSLSRVSPVFNLKMLVTAVLGLVFLSEPLTLNLVLGLFFGVTAVYLLGGEQ